MIVRLEQNYTVPTFKRRPQGNEVKQYANAVSQGLKVLNKKVGIIIHNSTAPSPVNKNLGIGSLLSKASEKLFIPFLAMNGITSIQQEPDNLRGKYDPSPYSPQSLAKNIYMLPIERLSTEEYENLIEEEDITRIIEDNNKTFLPNRVNYNKVSESYEKVLSKAYKNFINSEDKFLDLKNEFINFNSEKRDELTPAALYEIISKKYNNENWKTWDEQDRNLYVSSDKTELNRIQEEKAAEIDYFIFKQWIVEREIAKANSRNKEFDIKTIGDSPVAFTPVEVWMNQDLFLDGWALGCPPDGMSPNGQRWNFAVLKPEKIFNQDGSLGKGGELLKHRYEKMFKSSSGGVRIDHIIGLIDPFVYSTNEPYMNQQNSGRLYSESQNHVLGQYAKKSDKEYQAILEKIVFPAAQKYGLTKDDIICEDLGFLTKPVVNAMKNLGLSGIAITQYDYRGKDVPAKNVIMPGSHDNESYLEYTENVFSNPWHLEKKTGYLAEDTSIPDENKDLYKWEMATKKNKFISSSFTELFTSPAKKVQLFFTTFFGMRERYNLPGTTNNCWTLRIPENFEDLYWNNVKEGTAINIPEAIARAIRTKGEQFSSKHSKLLEELDKFAEILKL